MVNRKSIIVLLLIASCLILQGCSIFVEKGSETIQSENKDKTHEEISNTEQERPNSIEVEGIIVEETEKGVKLVSTTLNRSRGPIYNTQWLDDKSMIFNYDNTAKTLESTKVFKFDNTTNELQKIAEIDGEVWWSEAVNNGSEFIYSTDGFNGLYRLDNKGNKKQIMVAQRWYHISPDGKNIVIEGSPTNQGDNVEFKRYIYNIEEESLVEAPLIPSMEYVFSGIAATWSPDSIHISSQAGDATGNIKIINAIENSLTSEIILEDSRLTGLSWSPDGNKLGFQVQSSEYEKYYREAGEMYFWMSDKIGVYSVEENTVEYIDLKGRLTLNDIVWNDSSDKVFLQTATIDEVDAMINNLENEDSTNESTIDYLDIYTKNVVSLLQEDFKAADLYMVRRINPLDFIDRETLLYTEYWQNRQYIKTYNTSSKSTTTLFEDEEQILKWSTRDDRRMFITAKGIYEINQFFKIELVLDFDEYIEVGLVYIDASLSLDLNSVAVEVEFEPKSGKKNYIEVIKL